MALPSEGSRVKPLPWASMVNTLVQTTATLPWVLWWPPPSPISLLLPLTNYGALSARQTPIPLSKVRSCHSSAQNRPKACPSKFNKTLMIWPHLHPFFPCSLLLHTHQLPMNDHAKHILPQGLCTGCSLFLQLSVGLTHACFLGLCLNIPLSPCSLWSHQSRRTIPLLPNFSP